MQLCEHDDISTELKLVSAAEHPELADQIMHVMESTWPTFMLHDPVGSACWIELYLRFPEFQLVLLDSKTDSIVAIANSIPVHLKNGAADLSDRGWIWTLEKGIADDDQGLMPNTQIALAITVPPHLRGTGVGEQMILNMKAVGLRKGFKQFFGPLRPSQKPAYPLIPIEDYMHWKNKDGSYFDAWLRTHVKIGARVIRACHKSLHITGSVADWRRWTGMVFPQSGSYIIPEALVPLEVDVENDYCVYKEPNIWIEHPMEYDND